MAPLAEEGVVGMDVEAYPIAISAKDTSDASSFIRPTANVTACVDGGSVCAISTCDIVAMPGCATPTMGTLDVPLLSA